MSAAVCSLCSTTPARSDCFVRVDRDERPACRPCWEQLLLDPRRVLRSFRRAAGGSVLPDPSAS